MAKTALNRGTLEELRARTSSRREAARERDDQRFQLAGELAKRSRITIPDEKGYLILPPGSISEAQAVIDAGNQLVDSIGHDRLLTEFNPRSDTMSRGFLPEDAFELESPYMRFALSEDIISAASAYLGVVPILLNIDIWYAYAPPSKKGPINASTDRSRCVALRGLRRAHRVRLLGGVPDPGREDQRLHHGRRPRDIRRAARPGRFLRHEPLLPHG
jgi:hypothetical protein